MNALARYLLVFLLGWSGAVWSYSDLIYKEETPKLIKNPEKKNDMSLPNSLKPKSSEINELGIQEVEKNIPKKNKE
jgi:hypothetical protein